MGEIKTQDIIHNIPTGLFTTDRQFRVLIWNPMMETLTGLAADAIIDQHLFDHFPELKKTPLAGIFSSPPETGHFLNLDNCPLFSRESSHYKERYHNIKAKPLAPDDREIQCLCLLEETTSRYMTEHALRESERRLSTLMDNLPGMAYRILNDKHWTLEYVSRGSMDLLGFDSHYLQGNPSNRFSERVHPEDQEKVRKTIDQAVKNKTFFELFYRLRTASNVYRWVWEQGTGVFDQNGTLVALEGYVNDFTTPKATELELRRENERLRSGIKDRYRLGNMIGKSESMQSVYELVIKAAASDTNVIVYGDTGTGKELVAKAIHNLSDRKPYSFVPVNCGAMSETLLESEFFGHTKGAFTGANKNKDGYLDVADKGTLFLDELGEISLPLQVKLLRVLDGKGFSPVGSTRVKKPDIKIVAATNRNLKKEVQQGKIRQDFFYRIHVLPIYLPPLRERKEDIPLLIDYFLDLFHKQGKKASIPSAVREMMLNYQWPGNVSQLQNTILRYITLKRIDFIEQDPSNEPVSEIIPDVDSCGPKPLRAMMDECEKKIILNVLNDNQWQRAKVAKILGVDRKTLFSKMKRHQLNTS